MFHDWIGGNLFWPNWNVHVDEASSAQFLHCIFNRGSRIFKRLVDDNPIITKYGRRGAPQFWRNMREGFMISIVIEFSDWL